ncbi:MAG: PAS domain S-box protein [Candidatus Margulisbacteria bacterium]|nr:PAS domain S-box protein [Candidatus Margulisiibacteriota bacterium]MBU1617080.1 PAS domain S-box protein [Candidatus Margulisiibacteriota bacterium]MBU1867026.1 PAS domain S-box protein [Candidatus Margulisiibacteriota bacterium]
MSDKEKSEIRKEAEAEYARRNKKTKPSGSDADQKRLTQELQIHQIELEMQGEELGKGNEELRLEKEMLNNIISTAPAIILVMDPEGKIVSFNPYMEKLSGYSIDEVRGKDWFNIFLPERSRDKTREVFKRAINNIQTRKNIDLLITRDKRELKIEWYDKTLKDRDGKVVGLLSVGQDVTERKATEDALHDKIKELEKMTKIMEGREDRILELKNEIKKLKGLV